MSKTPERYANAEYAHVPERVRELIKEMRSNKKGIYLYGDVGTGKTHIAYAIKNKWEAVTGEYVEFWNTTELLQEIKDDFDRDAYSRTHTLERLMDSKKLLILDDIGVEKPSEWALERFYLLINRRYNEMRPIIFTSNFSLAELSDRIGERTVSRIAELCTPIKLTGTDRRIPS